MSVATEISKLQTNLMNAYSTVEEKGATLPANQNFDNLANAISDIPTDGIGITREVKNGVYQIPTESFVFSLPSDATDVGSYGLYGAFYNCSALTSVDLSSLTTVSGGYGLENAFYNCTALTSVDLSSLTTVSGDHDLNNAFYGCTSLTSVDLSSLTTVSGDFCFNSTFYGCTALTDIYFRALTTLSFGSYTNQFRNMMLNTGTTVTHTLHFPSNMESTISGLNRYPLFGGTDGYVILAFDLPATE